MNALSAGFQRIDHLVRPLPVGSSERVTRQRHFSAACSEPEVSAFYLTSLHVRPTLGGLLTGPRQWYDLAVETASPRRSTARRWGRRPIRRGWESISLSLCQPDQVLAIMRV